MKETIKMEEKNNQLSKSLKAENLMVYQEVVHYLRKSPVNSKKTEQVLAELLQHLLELEQIGKNSKDLFGENVQGYCRQLVKGLHKDTFWEKLNFALIIVASSTVFEIAFAFISGRIDWELSIAHIICNLFFAQLAFWAYGMLDQESKFQKNVYFFAFSTLFISVYVALGLLLTEK